ncbi:hypothetical protein ACFW04_005115 [Cataglyphis niger]
MGLSPILSVRNYSSILKAKLRARNDIFEQNDNSESEDDITSNSDDYTSSSDDSGENGNENDISLHKLFTPTLEDLKNVLYVALNPYFEEFEIAVVSCPCLTRAPYNLAAAGLSGNMGILKLGTIDYFYPNPQTDFAFDIRYILSRCNNDVFVIGSGFAAQPCMPYNGHLTLNAVVSANPTNVINNSCIGYENASTGQRILKIINAHNQIKCSLFGQFFFSEGKRGPVIKMRAKGRRSRSSIIALIQKALANRCKEQPLIGLGIVLVINGGQSQLSLLSNNFVNHGYNKNMDYYNRFIPCKLNSENLIALGALISHKLLILKSNYNTFFLRDETSMFNTFSNDKSSGNFFNDLTPEETEYIVYINTAQKIYL